MSPLTSVPSASASATSPSFVLVDPSFEASRTCGTLNGTFSPGEVIEYLAYSFQNWTFEQTFVVEEGAGLSVVTSSLAVLPSPTGRIPSSDGERAFGQPGFRTTVMRLAVGVLAASVMTL
jgi:hypothetical protein